MAGLAELGQSDGGTRAAGLLHRLRRRRMSTWAALCCLYVFSPETIGMGAGGQPSYRVVIVETVVL